MAFSDKHPPKAKSSMIEILLPGSNVKSDSFLHHRKQDAASRSTDEGMQIERSVRQDEKEPLPTKER
jgi:hypothetical protein